MNVFLDLWMPVVLSAVLVFLVSSITHMVLAIHRKDYGKLDSEDQVLEAMRGRGVKPGHYMFPNCESMKEMASPEMTRKFQQGPVGFMTILPNGPINMGRSLTLWFLYALLISLFVGYLGRLGLDPGTRPYTVFRFTGTAAILVYGVAPLVDSIWKGMRWGVTFKFVFDGILYGLATGGAFAWLWPLGA